MDFSKLVGPKDLTRVAPRSPRQRVGGYVILGRTIDKCRSAVAGTLGDYHYDCPLDRMLFEFKGIHADDFRAKVMDADSDKEVIIWFDSVGSPRTAEQIKAWGGRMEAYRPFDDPAKHAWFRAECEPLNLNPATTTMFDYLEADDRAFCERILRENPMSIGN